MSSPRFSDLNPPISKALAQALSSLGFDFMTPVQAASIPLFLSNKVCPLTHSYFMLSMFAILSRKDVSVQALTGSGKTLSFIIPIIEILSRSNVNLRKFDVGALVIAPSRYHIHYILRAYLLTK
jgi:ATP-dependent RNA helicase DDX55/SPB4